MYIIYGTPTCRFCKAAASEAARAGVDFEYVDLMEDDGAYDFVVMQEGHKTVPQVYWQTDDSLTHVGGYEDFKRELRTNTNPNSPVTENADD